MASVPRKFAQGTTVPSGKTRLEIEELLKKHGATSLIYGEQAAEHRRRWRALMLVLKGKLESIQDDTIETFEEAFLAHTVTPNGATVGEQMLPQLKDAYLTGRQPQMVLALPATGGPRP